MKPKARYSDEAIIAAIKAGGKQREEITAYLYERHVAEVIAFIQARKGSEAAARDVFQDAMIQLLVAVETDRFKGESALSTYLFAMSKNLWFRRYRRMQVAHKYLDTLEPEADRVAASTPEVELLGAEQQTQIGAIMDQLPEKCKSVLILWSMKYAMREIADQIGYKNEQVARNKKNMCLKALKALVREQPAIRHMLQELMGDGGE